VPYLE